MMVFSMSQSNGFFWKKMSSDVQDLNYCIISVPVYKKILAVIFFKQINRQTLSRSIRIYLRVLIS